MIHMYASAFGKTLCWSVKNVEPANGQWPLANGYGNKMA